MNASETMAEIIQRASTAILHFSSESTPIKLSGYIPRAYPWIRNLIVTKRWFNQTHENSVSPLIERHLFGLE